MRGRQIHGTARVGFGDGATPRSTLRLPAGPWDEDEGEIRWADRVVHLPDGWRAKVVPIRVRSTRSPDCYFFQLDGEGFSETVLFGVLIQP